MKTSFHFFYQKTFFSPSTRIQKQIEKKPKQRHFKILPEFYFFGSGKNLLENSRGMTLFSSSSNNDVLFLRRIFFDRILKRYIWKNLKHLFHGFLFLLFFDETHFLFFYHWIEKTPAWLKISSLILIFIAIIFVVRAFLNKIEIFNYSLAKLGNWK